MSVRSRLDVSTVCSTVLPTPIASSDRKGDLIVVAVMAELRISVSLCLSFELYTLPGSSRTEINDP
jgi:hypothetical protein